MHNQKSHHNRRCVGLVLALAAVIGAVTLIPGTAKRVSAQAAGPGWSYTGQLNTGRSWHTATLLSNGLVLVVGGYSSPSSQPYLRTAELYNPATGSWSYTGSVRDRRSSHSATLLKNGQVLVAGGLNNLGAPAYTEDYLQTAELYDPVSASWRPTGSFIAIRGLNSTILLPNGKVLAVGRSPIGFSVDSAELYDPATGTWSSTDVPATSGPMTLLPNGKVLAVSGSSAELYDPATERWSSVGGLSLIRSVHTGTLLQNGQVLFTGYGDGLAVNAEIYDPNTGTSTRTGNLHTCCGSTLLADGRVLMQGAGNSSAELYDPATGTWSLTSPLNTGRDSHTRTLLPDGKVLVAGGTNGDYDWWEIFRSAELYTPPANPTPNQIDDAQFFVRQHYRDFLNREPDAGGLAYWANRITECGSDSRCLHERRIGVSAAFFIEQEFQDTGYYVYRFYKASFGRQPNFTEFTSDRGTVIGGPDLEASKWAFADEWVQRPTFVAAYPITMGNTEFVNKVFDNAGLTASLYDPQRQQEILALNTGRSRALVLRDVIEIPDFKNIPDPNSPRYGELKQVSQYNPAFVLMQYFGYLRRDLDQSGFDFWLDIVNNREPNNYRGMVCSFLTSSEYQLRFGSVVTRTNRDCGS